MQFIPEKIEPLPKTSKPRTEVSLALAQGDAESRMSIPWASAGMIIHLIKVILFTPGQVVPA